MKEIKVGDYVRTNTGKIDKVINNNYYMSQYIECEKGIVDKENIVKHSKNIIDLLQVGDYVNGYKVISIDINALNDCKECIELDRNNTYEYQWISRNEIETILTKELYQANCYTVERKEEWDKD